ncbi:hypothetical protein UQ29_26115, partial [Escherichia coli]
NAAGRTSAFISGKAPEIKPSPGGNTPSGPSADTSVRTISLLPAAGEAAAQGWSIKDGGIQLSDGVFKITRQSNKTWSLTHPVDDAITLLTQGGRLNCKFRLSGALTNNQFGLGIYLYTCPLYTSDAPADPLPCCVRGWRCHLKKQPVEDTHPHNTNK